MENKNLISTSIFPSFVYHFDDESKINNLISLTDKYIEDAYSLSKNKFTNNKDFGLTHHSTYMQYDSNFKDFMMFVCNKSLEILDEQGFDMSNHFLIVNELWVQEFAKDGGGYHIPHIHCNSHISGFYFLKCSNKTSFPVFHDPRINKKMIQLPQKNEKIITTSSERIDFKVKPGLFVFFNSYLEHEFIFDHGLEPFRFIHFNVQAIPKTVLNGEVNEIKRK